MRIKIICVRTQNSCGPFNRHSPGDAMKPFGLMLVVLGFIGGVFAFRMETSVAIKDLGVATDYLGIERVNNIGLMDQRRNYLIISGLSILAGVLLFGFGSIRSSQSSETGGGADFRACPFCAEQIRNAATVCRFCNREVSQVASSSDLDPSGVVVVNAADAKTSCWTCTKFHLGDGWFDKYSDSTTGACRKHQRSTLMYETCPDHSPKIP